MSFVVKFLEEKLPSGLDLIVIIVVATPLTRIIGDFTAPVVDSTLLKIGQVLIASANSNPITMGNNTWRNYNCSCYGTFKFNGFNSYAWTNRSTNGNRSIISFGSSFLNFVLFQK